ncbi:hypothetical protein D9Q98_010661 [Chlorella vulgaris]|uniref:Reverse transcriptase domain-containing protein n=1 Tax=Chlorella vulgaris TaxID=3077 RepID=A0A9D4TEH7_CHLVU|nr:hypothetical protein D9Q98_010661 [Chlorella vulgaris]
MELWWRLHRQAAYLPPYRSKYGLKSPAEVEEYITLLGDEAAELQVLPEIPEYRGHRALSLELIPSPAPQRSTAKHADPESEGFGPPPTFATPLRLTPDRLSSFAAELKQPAKAEQLRRLTEEASRDPLLAAKGQKAATQLHAILYGTAAAVFPPTNAAPRQAAGSTSGQLRRRHQPWFDEECAATRRQIRLQMQASLNSGQPSHLAKEALRIISNCYTRLRKRKAGAWQRQQGSSLLHMQRTDARKFFKQWQREHPKSPIDAATWLRHFVNLQLKRTFQPTASLTATSNPATSHPTAAIPSCSPPTATVCPSSSHPTTAVPATSNPTTSHPTAAISSCSPSAATVPSSSQPTTAPPAINPATCHSTPLSTASSELDSDISVADVHAALDKLSSSSACLGPLKAVLIKAGRDALTPVLAALFNAVFRSGCFPPEWSLGAITPIHKKGDTADPNNYRGITVGHILGKLYALAINTRLNTWLETQGLRARGQAGFRQGYRTVDNCFILRALAERARSRGVKLYLCAVDFEKAFDSVDRPLLWAALQRAGIGGTMLQAIQAMYADVPVCVRTEEGLSGCFQSVLGVKQGCPLSPLLFGIFLDDFEGHIQQLGDAAALPQLAGRTVPPLLFADDMFLLSSSASGLQAQLHALQDYCNAKKLTVNAKKTQVMIMRPGGGSGNGKLAAGESFEYAGLPLEVASSTKYLGLTFSQLSKQHGFASCADVLAKAGRQAMFAMRRRAWELGACLVEQQCMLFDVFVKPVLSYGCELWGVDVLLRPDCSSVERVHRWFCRRVQGLPKQVTAAISLAELGRQPLQSFWIQQLVRFWNRLQNSAVDEDRVLGWAFKDNLELMREGGDLAAGSACWSRRWLHVLQSAPPASGTLEGLTELDEAAVIERAAAAYLRNSELDSDISVADVHAALDKLSSSSACLGPLKAVLIKAGRDALTPVLAALFNAVFRSGCFPPEWSLGAITPIHKKGDTADPNNYRGITVGHILGKLYALAINTRLNTWLETQGLRARGQAGFRQGYRTVDNCFILRALAERARSRGVKLYLCAVDFEKAFDSVDRPLLWAALQRAGIGGTMLQAIQAMYADVPVCVRTEEGLSGCFQSVLGVKQGCPLSPLLFGIFLDDFEGHIQQLGDAAALPQLAGRTVPPLLFADDMFLLSSSASGLQAQLHALQDYCNAKKLTVNAKKTQVMIMRPGGGSGNGKLAAGESFEYAGLPLEVASSTKYLGLTFSQLSKQHGFASCADVLAKAGRQAMFAMRRRAWELGACLVEQQCMLFDVFVKPVLSYGCELWGVDVLLRPDCSSVERVHRWFCRRVQGLPKQVTAAISLAELGRQPLQSFWIQQLVRFWNRLQNSAADEDRVLGHPRMAH